VKPLAARLFILAIITGLLISVCTPLTYLVWAWKAKQIETAALAQQIAREIQEIVLSQPNPQQYNIAPLNNAASSYLQRPEIKNVKIAANWSNSESSATLRSPSLFDIVQRVDLTFHGTTHGYVEVTATGASVIMSTLLLAGIFFGLALLINTLLYRLPVGIINQNERALAIINGKLKKTTDELAHATSILDQASFIDSISGLYNTSQSIKYLDEQMKKISQSGNGLLTVFLLDIDHFKQYNTHAGYAKGDEAITQLAALLKSQNRNDDLAGRLGGEEFIIIQPGVDQEQAAITANRLRISIESHPFPDEECQPDGKITVSIGFSTYAGSLLTASQLIWQAEQALNQAKISGRNKVAYFNASNNSID